MFRHAHTLARNFDYSPCWESAAARGLGLVASAHGAVDQAVKWLDDAYGQCVRGSATYQWVRCNALNSLCELAIAHRMPAAPTWLAALEEQAAKFGMHGFLACAVEHRERLNLSFTRTGAGHR